eukprot:TRINITY_DN17927_c0_g1_i1.p1 TRINITY_DN17927_c0_g1~~TRINITY_DN17927_c0_g1_i1.p1  ORF type:complete len:416 (-),score=73.59 TRINITY_DN17927_c0_g1_i1:252-1499(-)
MASASDALGCARGIGDRNGLRSAVAAVAFWLLVACWLAGCGEPPEPPLNCAGKVPHCARAFVPSSATDCSQAICRQCDEGYEFDVDARTLVSTRKCRFRCTSAQVEAGCAPFSCDNATSCSRCLPGFVAVGGSSVAASSLLKVRRLPAAHGVSEAPSCTPAQSAVPISFYMYRAQSDHTYPPENTDLASAAGVMWYLHNEVVCRRQSCPRHYDVVRVLRYRVTVYNTPEVYKVRHGQLGHFVQFDGGQCTEPSPAACPTANWKPYGFMVGCQPQFAQQFFEPAEKYGCFWYSLPGPCPSLRYDNPKKTGACATEEPGGRCSEPNGTRTCTWNYTDAGEVSVSELSGIADMDAFCAAGNFEYDDDTDRGKGTSFWDEKKNPVRGGLRVQQLLELFARKYPHAETGLELPDPKCTGW